MADTLRDHIISEIKRLAESSNGRAPGQKLFTAETGVRPHEWRGRYWVAWGDALKEAGYQPNEWTRRLDSSALLRSIACLALRLGHLPSSSELMLLRRSGEDLPPPKTIQNHFSRAELISELQKLSQAESEFSALLRILPRATEPVSTETRPTEGWVYLLASGNHYKIGRSAEIERRIKQIKVAQPEASELVHAIRTDDPSGIEGYWHRRFADKRANGEWFKLTRADIAAFRRRRFQ